MKATIENVYVLPDYRGAGVGSELVERLLDLLTRKGCEYAATLVPPDASEAVNLYEHAGFTTGEKFLWLDIALSDHFSRANHERIL